jgi:hypothetical protein
VPVCGSEAAISLFSPPELQCSSQRICGPRDDLLSLSPRCLVKCVYAFPPEIRAQWYLPGPGPSLSCIIQCPASHTAPHVPISSPSDVHISHSTLPICVAEPLRPYTLYAVIPAHGPRVDGAASDPVWNVPDCDAKGW